MVKIVNSLGDIKVGRQGEAVYQRKYGQQIRRTAQPKRAIVSQRQMEHRQLYRAALDWRKQLSLPNRRYLDGYCIANGLVDDYHIPLPWSKFALKIYLEHAHFVIIEKPTLTTQELEGKNQAYDNEADLTTYQGVNAATWRAQTFTPSKNLQLTKVQVFVCKYGTPSAGHVRLRATNAQGHPTGADLAHVNIPYGSLPSSYTWMGYLLTYPNLSQGVKYALIINMDSGTTSNQLRWKGDSSSPTYAGGNLENSSDSGVNWTTAYTWDMGFRIFGKWTETIGEAGLLHVRHPALLTVVQMRGQLIVTEYDTLSSLDDQYLTGQVGLDILPNDLIEATTLPGIEFAYQVP